MGSYIDGYYSGIDNASYIDFCNALESILHIVSSVGQPPFGQIQMIPMI